MRPRSFTLHFLVARQHELSCDISKKVIKSQRVDDISSHPCKPFLEIPNVEEITDAFALLLGSPSYLGWSLITGSTVHVFKYTCVLFLESYYTFNLKLVYFHIHVQMVAKSIRRSMTSPFKTVFSRFFVKIIAAKS